MHHIEVKESLNLTAEMNSLQNSALGNVLLGTVELIEVPVLTVLVSEKSRADWRKRQLIKRWYFFLSIYYNAEYRVKTKYLGLGMS